LLQSPVGDRLLIKKVLASEDSALRAVIKSGLDCATEINNTTQSQVITKKQVNRAQGSTRVGIH
jgi:hypothetical protein